MWLVPAVAALALAPGAAPATLQLSAKGERALHASGVTIAGTRLAVTTFRGSSATLGGLTFRAGKRRTATGPLTLTVGSSAISLTGKVGAKRARIFALTPSVPAELGTGSLRLSGAKVALTRTAAKRLKRALRLRRTPPTGTLGTFSLVIASPPAAPAPAPPITVPAPAPAQTPTPAVPCSDRFAATPAGSVDWFGCDLAGSSDLRSWTDYVQRPFPSAPGCPSGAGTVTASGGATQLDVYDHRFPITSVTATTIRVQGSVTYAMPVHGIDEAIGDFRIELDGQHGAVYAGGHDKDTDMSGAACTTPATPYSDERVFDLDLTGITPVTSSGVKRWIHVPATIAAGTTRVGGGSYPAGRPWGAFTIAVPVP